MSSSLSHYLAYRLRWKERQGVSKLHLCNLSYCRKVPFVPRTCAQSLLELNNDQVVENDTPEQKDGDEKENPYRTVSFEQPKFVSSLEPN